jgi:class 3 adenylate cyclase
MCCSGATSLRDEADLLRRALAVTGEAFAPDRVRVALLSDGELGPVERATLPGEALRSGQPAESAGRVLPPHGLAVDGGGQDDVDRGDREHQPEVGGVVLPAQVQPGLREQDPEHEQGEGEVERPHHRPHREVELRAPLCVPPAREQGAILGGGPASVKVLRPGGGGGTTFAERADPGQVVSMLNTYFSTIVPIVLEGGGTVIQFVGDALMAIFNAPSRQPDHALRGARAALRTRTAAAAVAAGRPGWPRFRIGVNTGPALVGNIGAEQMRNFTAIGDTTNLAARLETGAPEGEVVIGAATYRQISDAAVVEPLGSLQIRGKSAAVEAYRLVALREPPGAASGP